MLKKYIKPFLITIGFVLVSCTNVTLNQDVDDYKPQILDLAEKIKQDPNDLSSLRELGVICVKTGVYDRGEEYLQGALELQPDDPQSLFYYGLALEFNNKTKEAFQVFRKFPDVSRLSPYRKLLEGRYTLLSQEIAEQDAKALLDMNSNFTSQPLSPNLIAVFPFTSRSSYDQYANLGRGLGEMMITDLSQVPDIELVERIRLNAIMEEIALGQSGMIQEGSEAKYGKLLGAGKVITGYYDVLEDNILMDVELYNHQVSDKPRRANTSNKMSQLFLVEKKLVLGIVASMGIELTPEQRKSILHIPTRNLQAFLEYCNGLEKQDAGQYNAAVNHFKKAVKMDPAFEASSDKLEQTESAMTMSTADREQLLAMTDLADAGISLRVDNTNNPRFDTRYKINHRLQSQSDNMGNIFIPGEDSRKTSEEAVGSRTSIAIDGEYIDILPDILPGQDSFLPDPPPPPGGM